MTATYADTSHFYLALDGNGEDAGDGPAETYVCWCHLGVSCGVLPMRDTPPRPGEWGEPITRRGGHPGRRTREQRLLEALHDPVLDELQLTDRARELLVMACVRLVRS